MKKEFIKKIIRVGIATLIITNMYYIPASAKWVNDSKNNWNWIENEVRATGWKQINEKWYYFNEDGVMRIGWLNYNGKWYNLSNGGTMEIGWKQIDGKWYYFSADGIMSIGWIDDNGSRYFTNSSGEMQTGTLGIDGQVYIFSNSGALLNEKETIQNTQSELEVLSNGKSNNQERVAYVSTNSNCLNIRSEASISSDVIGTLLNGEEIKIIDEEKDGFYNTIANGTKGWVKSEWVSFEKLAQKPINEDINITLNGDSKEEIDSVNDENIDSGNDLKKGEIRDIDPSLNNKHYYSDMNLFYKVRLSPPFSSGGKLIKGNCTWYAWGRAWEITGIRPNDAGFKGNAYEWWEANKKSGKYQYGSEPRVGSIAVWKSELPNSGGCGHVAVVEKFENGKIYISESMWHGVTFKYREIYDTSYLYGYIYLDKPNY
ncbi:MAG: CHAP domain-containing protein [Clostridium sp.]|uniref:CHAP domain-containing protein n=1 Tax=Clostridium sp. TaxID=1506 RepID=UPI0025BB3891|nr:CHAP domain-containing protein [Clostridium sp.]MCE5221747.1 CHAP domain-containing protein [Clostridium sp.]